MMKSRGIFISGYRPRDSNPGFQIKISLDFIIHHGASSEGPRSRCRRRTHGLLRRKLCWASTALLDSSKDQKQKTTWIGISSVCARLVQYLLFDLQLESFVGRRIVCACYMCGDLILYCYLQVRGRALVCVRRGFVSLVIVVSLLT